MSHAPAPESQSDEENKITPPDGGWGWVVVFASFMIHIITDGVTYTFGIFYDALLKYFNSSNAATAWIVSILVGVTLCSGPLSSAFVNRYGCRPVTIAGAILASMCMIASIFANSIYTLYITIGLGTGLGFGLIYLPAIVSVTCYFEKYRSLATGIAVCGSGLGTFVFAPVVTWLVKEYGWRGSMLIIGGLLLNCVIFGVIFRPLVPKKKKNMLLNVHDDNSHSTKKDNFLKVDFNNVNEIQNNTGSTKNLNSTSNKAATTQEANGEVQKRPHSVHLFPNATPVYQMNGTATAVTATATTNNSKSVTTRLAVSQPHLVSTNDRRLWGSQVLRPTRSGIMQNKNIFYRGSLAQLHHTNRTYSWMNIEKTQEEKALMEKPKNLKIQKDNTKPGCCGLSEDSMNTLKEMLDLSLLKDPIFIIFTVSNFCTSIGFYVPYVYIVVQARQKGLEVEKANMLLAVIGIANTVGRIALGYLSDKPWVNRLWVYNTCLTICGIGNNGEHLGLPTARAVYKWYKYYQGSHKADLEGQAHH
ncbi:monocarboxylate transporter 1 isoform X2 [Lycorma delicatula]|uniref:monocarboxylate transporter 1 isoform X2 n=1 Tax=Lycorma delicatula TaxID=130591 RepID=UPI003F50E0D0